MGSYAPTCGAAHRACDGQPVAVDGAFGPHVPAVSEFARTAEGRLWVAALPDIVDALEKEWELETGPPFLGGSASWVAPATLRDGSTAVLKLNYPHREARGEATALGLWDGHGAVRLYRSDIERWALLIERCEPGTALHKSGVEPEVAFEAAAVMLNQLWEVPPPPPGESSFEQLGDVTREWAGHVRRRFEKYRPPFDTALVEMGARLLETLPDGGRHVVLHGDFNPGNILSAARRPWLAIDAKSMVGDAAYDPSPLLFQVDDPFDANTPQIGIRDRAELVGSVISQPSDRMLAWAVARFVEAALWHVDRGEHERAEETMINARVLADLAGL